MVQWSLIVCSLAITKVDRELIPNQELFSTIQPDAFRPVMDCKLRIRLLISGKKTSVKYNFTEAGVVPGKKHFRDLTSDAEHLFLYGFQSHKKQSLEAYGFQGFL